MILFDKYLLTLVMVYGLDREIYIVRTYLPTYRCMPTSVGWLERQLASRLIIVILILFVNIVGVGTYLVQFRFLAKT